jgi:hypothetical protein
MSVRRVIYSFAALLIGLGIIGAYFAFRSDLARNHSLTKESMATIENVDVQRAVNPASGAEQTVGILVQYRYSVNGLDYRRTTTMSSLAAERFIPWGTAKVCYDPENLNTVEAGKLFPPTYKCGVE